MAELHIDGYACGPGGGGTGDTDITHLSAYAAGSEVAIKNVNDQIVYVSLNLALLEANAQAGYPIYPHETATFPIGATDTALYACSQYGGAIWVSGLR